LHKITLFNVALYHYVFNSRFIFTL
jgi:hypothetical protein